jgi:dephospho-CoA kinase
MIILGLTGGIATGKSTVARQLANLGAAVCDSDTIVHALLKADKFAIEQVSKAFPKARKDNAINRKALALEVFGDDKKLKILEAILHPLVRKYQDAFIQKARRRKVRVVVLDIPLLYETHAEKRCDYVIVASAPAFLQRQRALTRLHMTREKLEHILARQMPEPEKRKRADFIVLTGNGKHASLKMVKNILRLLQG